MDTQSSFTPLIIIAVLVFAIGLGGTAFLYTKHQSLLAEKSDLQSTLADKDVSINNLENENAKSAQELAALKATDLAKEVELLRTKLRNTEESLAKVRGEVVPLEATMTKIGLYADVVAAIDQNLVPPPPTPVNSNLNNIDVKIEALNDNQIIDQWVQTKSAIDAGRDGGADIIHTYFLVISQMRKLLP